VILALGLYTHHGRDRFDAELVGTDLTPNVGPLLS
jgi:hypothetical protein